MPDPNCNVALIDIPVNEIIYKWKAFEKVRAISNLTTDIKSSVYEKYSDFDPKGFKESYIVNKMEEIFTKVSGKGIENKLQHIDFFFDKIMLNKL